MAVWVCDGRHQHNAAREWRSQAFRQSTRALGALPGIVTATGRMLTCQGGAIAVHRVGYSSHTGSGAGAGVAASSDTWAPFASHPPSVAAASAALSEYTSRAQSLRRQAVLASAATRVVSLKPAPRQSVESQTGLESGSGSGPELGMEAAAAHLLLSEVQKPQRCPCGPRVELQCRSQPRVWVCFALLQPDGGSTWRLSTAAH